MDDVKSILEAIAEIRSRLPRVDGSVATRRGGSDGRMTLPNGHGIRTMQDFEVLAMLEALQSLDDEMSTLEAHTMEQALRTYYVAEELSRDPAHADLIPVVENLRRIYEKENGEPIPPKPKDW